MRRKILKKKLVNLLKNLLKLLVQKKNNKNKNNIMSIIKFKENLENKVY